MKIIIFSLMLLSIDVGIAINNREDGIPYASGVLLGHIKSADNKPLAEVLINIVNTHYSCLSDSMGMFEFQGLPPGTYIIQTVCHNYHKLEQPVLIRSKQPITYCIKLWPKDKKTIPDKRIILTWRRNPEPDLAGYNIYRSPNPFEDNIDVVCIGTVSKSPEPSFMDTIPMNGYNFYGISAYDSAGQESRYSDQLCYYVPSPSRTKLPLLIGLIAIPLSILIILLK